MVLLRTLLPSRFHGKRDRNNHLAKRDPALRHPRRLCVLPYRFLLPMDRIARTCATLGVQKTQSLKKVKGRRAGRLVHPCNGLRPNGMFAVNSRLCNQRRRRRKLCLHLNIHNVHHDIPTKIVEDDEDEYAERSETEAAAPEPGLMGKHAESLMHRPAGARISALGGTR